MTLTETMEKELMMGCQENLVGNERTLTQCQLVLDVRKYYVPVSDSL
jgi:hypothetical protein